MYLSEVPHTNSHNGKTRIGWLLLVATLFVFACGSKQVLAEVDAEAPKILFLNYNISKTDSGIAASFINQIVADGKVKGYVPTFFEQKIGTFEVVQQDEKKRPIQQHFVENPLTPNLEAINDNGEFERHQMDFDKAQLSLRLPLYKATKFVTLRYWNQETQAQTLLTTQIILP